MDDADDDKPEEPRRSSLVEGKPKERKSKSAKFVDDEGAGERRKSTKQKKEDEGEEKDEDEDAFKKQRKSKSASVVEGDDTSGKGKRRSSAKRMTVDEGEGGSQRRKSTKRESVAGRRKSTKTDIKVDEGKETKSSKDDLEDKDTEGTEGEDTEEGIDKTRKRRKTLQELQQEEDEKFRGHANEVGKAVDERDRQYRESLKIKVGEGWVIDKGKRTTRASLGLESKKIIKPKKTIQGSVVEPEMQMEARPSAIRRMQRRERGEPEIVEAPAESPLSTDTTELKEIPVRPLFSPDEDVEAMSVIQDAFTKLMFGAIEERMVKGDVKLPKSPTDRSLTDVEKLLGLPPVDYDWEEMSGEGEETLTSPRDVEELMITEKALLAQEAYHENAPLEKPKMKKKVRKLSEILHEIEDDFKKLYELVDEEGEGEELEGEEEEGATAGAAVAATPKKERAKEEEGEWDLETRERERYFLREQGRELVKTIQRYRGTGFGMNLGDILGWDSFRKYEGGIQELGEEGLTSSEMDFLITALQQKLSEEKEQNERMLDIMRKRQFRVKQLYDAENMRFVVRRSIMLQGDDEEEDLRMLWDYIDEAMIYFRKAERYM